MKFFNRFVLFYSFIVVLLTLAYYYIVIHLSPANSGMGIWLFAAYMALVFGAALFINLKDENSGYMGFNYHLSTYIIVTLITVIIVFSQHDENKDSNIKTIGFTTLIWGIGILFHFGLYRFKFRKRKIGSYEKDDVFK